ncbi:hypothetical protein N7499_012305 [Penicillium canescens]|uniref:YCII-related domain-containing protein n=1 Tax=Penicillium canescens TaxID=5083 RepID=A0AAD6N4I9_PENCN|nr:hypothetical protein N7460_010158 [Penicillium canescens]KAJ6060270.1 hypothetical protein N7444_002124 [Penicillium canescens]KAJ6063625.1 hypothetical protein N7499_012305 [Penicillium canescens]
MLLNRFVPRATGSLLRSTQSARGVLLRSMATARKKKEFLCIMPDRPNVLELRKKVKGCHYEGIQPLIAGGKLVDGGAVFAEHPQEGKKAQFLGSVVVYTGENAEEVREIISNDIYASSGVWDLEKVQIYPYVPAVRQPLP